MYPKTFVKKVTQAAETQFPGYNQLLGRAVNPETGEMIAVHRVREGNDMRVPPNYAVYYAEHSGNGGSLESEILTKEDVSHPESTSQIGMVLSTQWGEVAFAKPDLVPVRLGGAVIQPLIIKS